MASRHGERSLCLSWGIKEWSITPESTAIRLGRDAQCDIVVNEPYVSRIHARIHFRRDHFLLEDHSTNGTYVRTDDGNTVYLRREKLPLWGHGIISLGKPPSEATVALIDFQLVQ